ncbi:hypothetical protein BKA65DRAFT_520944 [Rhexocercosporidium sp. MPI-PUGE-AT-0058]|nr:hypothetical protein BKA65DRAFT_520944 [Rhexocercosporidium sp. MPI-PUGE-AT-0058]
MISGIVITIIGFGDVEILLLSDGCIRRRRNPRAEFRSRWCTGHGQRAIRRWSRGAECSWCSLSRASRDRGGVILRNTNRTGTNEWRWRVRSSCSWPAARETFHVSSRTWVRNHRSRRRAGALVASSGTHIRILHFLSTSNLTRCCFCLQHNRLRTRTRTNRRRRRIRSRSLIDLPSFHIRICIGTHTHRLSNDRFRSTSNRR